MSNKKSLLQDSLQELENIKNESLELAKEQLINESADLLEKKSAALFEKLISEEVGSFEDMPSDVETEEEPSEPDTDEDDEEEITLDEILAEMTRDSEESQEKTLDEILAEIKNSEGMYDDESDDDDESDEEDYDEEPEESDEEEMSLDDLRDAAEKMGLKLVKDTEDGEEEDGEEEDDDIEFTDDEDEFTDVQVDDEVLAENNNRFKNTKVMKNNRKEALKDLRDVSFNRLVEAYYNMNESDAFIIKENEYMDEEDEMDYAPDPDSAYEDRFDLGHEHESSWMDEPSEDEPEEDEMDEMYNIDEMDYMDEEDTLYEVEYPESETLSDEELNEMLSEMDIETDMPRRVGNKMRPERMEGNSYMDEEMYGESIATDTRDKYIDQGLTGPIYGKAGVDESMFEDLTMEELEEIKEMLDGDMDTEGSHQSKMHSPKDDFLSEDDINEMISEMEGDEMEESMSTRTSQAHRHQARPSNRAERVRPLAEEESEEEMMGLKEQLKKLQAENKALNEGFTNKVKSLENKVYDVTISALKAGFVNKFLLEHPLRENEKLEIIHRFSNAQTKEQIKETYISLTNEFAKGQTVKDGSMLNESVQNRVGRVHRTDNAIVTEKNLMNENDESLRFKQLLNYNFGRKK